MSGVCHHCGTTLLAAVRGRPRRYCKDACRLLAFRESRAEPCNEIQPQPDSDNFVAAVYGSTGDATSDPDRRFQAGPTPGALQGDDYPLEFYPDGYPLLPASLDR